MRVWLEEDPTPLVAATANDLERCLEDPEFAAATARLEGVVSVKAAEVPESVTLSIAAEQVSLIHGVAEDADLRITIGPEPAERAIEGRDEHPELAGWLEQLLDPSQPPWPDAAARFWSVLSAMPGAPGGLRVVDLDTAEERRFGSDDGSTYEIHGSADGLVAVLSGRAPLIDAAYERTVFIRGSFPQLSVLTGAGFEIRYGRGRHG